MWFILAYHNLNVNLRMSLEISFDEIENAQNVRAKQSKQSSFDQVLVTKNFDMAKADNKNNNIETYFDLEPVLFIDILLLISVKNRNYFNRARWITIYSIYWSPSFIDLTELWHHMKIRFQARDRILKCGIFFFHKRYAFNWIIRRLFFQRLSLEIGFYSNCIELSKKFITYSFLPFFLHCVCPVLDIKHIAIVSWCVSFVKCTILWRSNIDFTTTSKTVSIRVYGRPVSWSHWSIP